MLQRIELEVLAAIERGDTIPELATTLDHSESYLSRAVADLVEKGLVYTERNGRRKQVVPSDSRAVEAYQDLVRQHSHIDFTTSSEMNSDPRLISSATSAKTARTVPTSITSEKRPVPRAEPVFIGYSWER